MAPSMTQIRRRRFVLTAAALAALGTALPLALPAAEPSKPYVARGTKQSIVPVVKRLLLKPGEGGQKVQNFAPLGPLQVEGFDVPEEQSPVVDSFVGELGVFYGFDSPKGIAFANMLDLKALGVARDEVRKLATVNYRRLYPGLRLERLRPGLYLVVDGGELESSVLLDPVFWERQKLSVSGELVAAAPARDVVLFSGSNPRENVAELRRIADQIFRKGHENLLSSNLYVWRGGRWEVFGE